jgi:hypothetical protein
VFVLVDVVQNVTDLLHRIEMPCVGVSEYEKDSDCNLVSNGSRWEQVRTSALVYSILQLSGVETEVAFHAGRYLLELNVTDVRKLVNREVCMIPNDQVGSTAETLSQPQLFHRQAAQ